MQHVTRAQLGGNVLPRETVDEGLRQRRNAFAREAMLTEFGRIGHLRDEQWGGFTDISPKRLVIKRKLVLWQEPSS